MLGKWYFRLIGVVGTLILLTPVVMAQTYAYIPSYEDDRVVRVNTTSLDIEEVTLTDCSPYGAAVMPQGAYVLVTCWANDRIYKITNSNFEGIGSPSYTDVGTQPRGIAIDPSQTYAYATNFNDDNVSELNLGAFTESDTMNAGSGPWGVAAHYDEATDEYIAYVANYNAGTISVMRNGSVSDSISLGGKPVGLGLSPDGGRLYAAVDEPDSAAEGELAIIRTRDLAVMQRKEVPSQAWGVAVGSDGDVVYITQNSAGAPSIVSLYYPDEDIKFEIDINAANLTGIAAPKNGDFAYVISQTTNDVYKIDPETLTAEAVVEDEIDGAYALGAFIGGTPPTAPSALTAEAKSYNEIQLSWDDNATDELGYKIERRIEGDDTYAPIAKTQADATEYSDDGLAGDTTYEYRIRAYNEAADSNPVAFPAVTTEEGYFSWCFINTLLRQ